jgi:hypothetical protein
VPRRFRNFLSRSLPGGGIRTHESTELLTPVHRRHAWMGESQTEAAVRRGRARARRTGRPMSLVKFYCREIGTARQVAKLLSSRARITDELGVLHPGDTLRASGGHLYVAILHEADPASASGLVKNVLAGLPEGEPPIVAVEHLAADVEQPADEPANEEVHAAA